MKKLILIATLLISVIANGQMLRFTDTLDVSTFSGDTVLQARKMDINYNPFVWDVMGYYMTVTLSSEGLTAPVSFQVGGSNKIADETLKIYAFEALPILNSDTYVYDPDDLQVITNFDTTNQITMFTDYRYPLARPEWKVINDSSATGLFIVDWLFYK